MVTVNQGSQNAARRVRFGPFELDLKTGELRKSGMRVRLERQPFQVLAALLEHPGELITRDEFAREALVRRHLRRFRPRPDAILGPIERASAT